MRFTPKTLTLACMMGGALITGTAHAAAVIVLPSGLVALGVNDQGHLNYTDGVTTSQAGPIGVSYNFGSAPGIAGRTGWQDATSPGCLCEGWGVSGVDSTSTTHIGYADIASGGISNISVDSFASTATTATSAVHLTDLPDLQVTQAYQPSSSGNLFEDVVTITNNGASTITDVRYTRSMDWDVPPTEFNEYVTIGGWPASALLHSSDNGFQTPDPTLIPGSICLGAPADANFDKVGICDHGAVFTFSFGDLDPGASKTFSIFYGAGANEVEARAALASVKAEVYSLGISSSGGPPATDLPVYAFGFKGVGGTPITAPEPASIVLLGSGLLGLAMTRRRKTA